MNTNQMRELIKSIRLNSIQSLNTDARNQSSGFKNNATFALASQENRPTVEQPTAEDLTRSQIEQPSNTMTTFTTVTEEDNSQTNMKKQTKKKKKKNKITTDEKLGFGYELSHEQIKVNADIQYKLQKLAFTTNIDIMLSYIAENRGTVIDIFGVSNYVSNNWVEIRRVNDEITISLDDNDLDRLFCEIGLRGTHYMKSPDPIMFHLLMLIHRIIEYILNRSREHMRQVLIKESFRNIFIKFIGDCKIITLEILNDIFYRILGYVVVGLTQQIAIEMSPSSDARAIDNLRKNRRKLIDPIVWSFVHMFGSDVAVDFFQSQFIRSLLKRNTRITSRIMQHYFLNREIILTEKQNFDKKGVRRR